MDALKINPLPAHLNAIGYYTVGCCPPHLFAALLRKRQGIAITDRREIKAGCISGRRVTMWVWWRW